MNKIQLGTDFTSEEGATGDEEAEQIKPDESQDDEKENSAGDADSETEEDSKEDSAGSESAEDDESKDDSKETDATGQTDDEKRAELQGLLGTEKALSENLVSLDDQIKAARQRISQKRGERREKRELTQSIDSALPPEEDTDDLSDIDADTLKVLDRFAKAKGLVPKSELHQMNYQSAHKTAEETFYESHPEYKPENDTDDVLYDALKTELSLYNAPKDARLIPKLFEKAHNEVARLYPDRFIKKAPDKKSEAVSDETKAAAGRIKKQQTGGGPSGGGSSGSGSAQSVSGTKKSLSDVQVRALQEGGWSQEEIKKLTT